MGLERGPISLVRITEEILEWKSSGSGSRKQRLTAVGDPFCANSIFFNKTALQILFILIL
jgi:hypothetical protein